MLEIGGLELLPHWPVFLTFVVAGLALNIIPGADMAFIIASAARGGRRHGIVASLGIGSGALVHILAAVLGLSAILASSEAAFNAVKWIGAAYLLWLAVSLLRPNDSTRVNVAPPPVSDWQVFRAGMLVNILNPKVALFFLAFLPQFVDPAAQAPALQILFLGLWFDLAGTVVNMGIAVAAAGAARRLHNIGWIARFARWIAATVMAGMALQLALGERR
ncbi:MAG: LysE family translocator [Sphingomicrobium sp.]